MFKYILLSIHLLCVSSFAQESLGKVENFFKVDGIEVAGAKKVEPEAVIEKISLKEGSMATNYSIREAIKSIYDLKYFEIVEAHQIKKDGKNILQFKVKEKPIVSKIIFEGNDEVSSDDLREQVKTREFNILDVNTVKSDVAKVQDFYEEKGFFLANVDYELVPNSLGGVDLKFMVREFDKVRVKRIMFLGNNEIEDDELKGFMQTREESLFSPLSGSGNFKEFNFKNDVERLKYLYKTRGYLQVNIGNPSITVSEDKKWIFITIKVNEGPKFSINNIFYNGELLFTESEMREKTQLKSGDTYSEETLRQDIQALTEMYQDKGYAFANVLRTLQMVPGENKVDINYSFEKGEIAYFGKIIVKGNTKTRDKVVRRELRIHEGMMYSGSLLRKSKENVVRLGFFEPASVVFNTVSPKGSNNVLNVEISVKERQTGQISVGAGYSTATKGFFQASVSQNNFRGLGQNLNLNVSLAEQQKTYNLGFTEPYFLDTKWTAGGDIYRTQSGLISSFSSEKYGGDVRVGYPIFEYTRLFMTLRHEVTDIQNVRNPTVDEDIENGTAATVQMSLRMDKRNNIFEPSDGHFGSATIEYAGFYGDQKWLKASLEGRFYEPVYKELVFRSRLRAEQLMKTSTRELPRTEKFQLGGARNMRGYDFEDIGPKELLEDEISGEERLFNIGGQFSILTTLELEHPLIKEAGLKWVVFYDAGNVYENSFGEDGNITLRQDYGFGFRWFSPIGVLRFEFGYPIDPEEGQDGQQFHFDIGQLF
ncbi:MAG: outer membrane protein assembly factor BamA [Halobacteriovoraceae bacterium]|nr:outer membrane protein assembly factor BamA [Halobacteriovoraceae bacterium]|tara:strand:+ start:19279 stop:21570 length:2292 start_codon:yes stop_codon:yes gene_type:complete